MRAPRCVLGSLLGLAFVLGTPGSRAPGPAAAPGPALRAEPGGGAAEDAGWLRRAAAPAARRWGLASPEAAPRFAVTAGAFAYCQFEEKCPLTRVLRIGTSPMQFVVETRADDELKRKEMDFLIELLTLGGETIFDYSFTLPLNHVPYQHSRLLFKKQPPAIAALEPGKYMYRITVMSSDGSLSAEWSRAVVARR